MNDIINQIIQIDSFAFENKNKYEEILSKKKLEYESILVSYKKEKLEAAQIRNQMITEEAETFILENEKLYKDKILKISTKIDNIYKKTEKDLTQKIFNKIFVLEG